MIGPSLGSLRVRLLLLMLLALFPLGLIAMWQTFRVVEETRTITRQMMLDTTAAAAVDQRGLIQRVVGAGFGLGAMARVADTDTCRSAMADFLKSNDTIAFAGYVPRSGIMSCSSSGDAVVDFSDYPNFTEAIDRDAIFVEVNNSGAVSGTPVIIVNVPVRDDGAFEGFVSLSMPQDALRGTIAHDVEGLSLVAISTSGVAFDISGLDGDAADHLPRDVAPQDMFARAGTTFSGFSKSGVPRIFSVTSAIEDSYVVVGSWPNTGIFERALWVQAALPALFAVIMWAASMLVAYFGLDRLVLRHLKALRSAMRQFALGERSTEGLVLEDAPNEFEDAQRAFNRMTLLITEAEARQLTDLHDKEVLLREVHHRVKNNLQMIASIMNLQSRTARSAETREMLGGLQRRVRGLATLHRSLYAHTDTSQVDARELLDAVVAESSAILPGKTLEIRKDLASFLLYPDQAVPLSMWAAEALTNAVKYVGRNGDETPYIKVTATHDGAGTATLSIENSTGTPLIDPIDDEVESTGLGTKLMIAFCRQLEGEAETTDVDGAFALRLRFSIQGFADDATTERQGAHEPA